MKLTAHTSDIWVSEPTVMMHSEDCLKLGVGPEDRVRITSNRSVVTSVVITDTYIQKGVVMMPATFMKKCDAEDGDEVEVVYSPMPESARSIRKKINGEKLDRVEIDSIVQDIMDGDLSEKEIIAFVSSFNVNNSDLSEVAYLTRSMAATGTTVDLGSKTVFDFHSLGGVPGNKITPIVVSIVASSGMIIPKFSSRSISSACGTSDYVDTFCDVELNDEELKSAMAKTGGVFACGNKDYAPVGDFIIKAERPMGIDPRPTMMASIMSKKVAIGTTHLLTDIPTGKGAKVPDMETAESLAKDMIDLGTILGMHVECAITYADQPIGSCIGPILEAKECIKVLEDRTVEGSVAEKACGIAGILMEMKGCRDGRAMAEEILRSGRAHRKFLEIVEAQKGRPDLKSDDLSPGKFVKDVHAKRNGRVQFVDNSSMVAIAKGAGAPADLGAGIEILHKIGDEVKEGDVLFRIYAENESKLNRAIDSARSRRPMEVRDRPVSSVPSDIILRRIPSKEILDLIRYRDQQSSC